MENPFETLEKRLLTGMEDMLKIMLSNIPGNIKHPNRENYLTTEEAGAFIKKTPNAIRQLVYKNVIPYLKITGRTMFLESDLIKWMESGRVMTNSEMQEDAESILLNKKKGTKI